MTYADVLRDLLHTSLSLLHLTGAVRVNMNDDDLQKRVMTDKFQNEGHRHLDLTIVECWAETKALTS